MWLDPARTSPYRFYQFWINADDRDAIQYLKFFTLLPRKTIEELEHAVNTAPEKREAQTTLAREVTRALHGEAALAQSVKAARIFFGGEIGDMSETELLDIFSEVPSIEISRDRLGGAGILLLDLLVTTGVVKSKGEARRAIEGGGIYLNNVRVTDVDKKANVDDATKGKFVLLRKGARNYFLVKLT